MPRSYDPRGRYRRKVRPAPTQEEVRSIQGERVKRDVDMFLDAVFGHKPKLEQGGPIVSGDPDEWDSFIR